MPLRNQTSGSNPLLLTVLAKSHEQTKSAPACRRKLNMQVAHVEPHDGQELWVFRCISCGAETSVAMEPLASPQLATASSVSERQLICALVPALEAARTAVFQPTTQDRETGIRI